MSDCPINCLSGDLVYYVATKISRRDQTRFDINTGLFNPLTKKYIQLKLPIESILLYHYKTPLADHLPKKIFNHKLNAIDFSALNALTGSEIGNKKIHKDRIFFEFTYYSPILKKNITILLPKLVLARDLFFSHPYLLRAAFFAENYSTDILVDMNDDKAIHIFIAQNKKISKQDLSDPEFLKKLALILLQPDLNRAFLSIYKKTIADQKGSKNFDFDMDAPEIAAIDLSVSGIYDEETDLYRIERITSFKNVGTNINRPIKFHFSSKKVIQQIKKVQAQGSKKSKTASHDKTQLDQKADADIDKILAKLRNIAGAIYTTEELKIILETPPAQTQVQIRQQQMNENQNQEGFAGGEGDIDGTLPGFTTQSEIQLERVTHQDLIQVLDKIKEKGYEIQGINNLPFKKYGNFRNHTFGNNQPRYFYVYKIKNKKNHEQFYLCEIDTSDEKKNISTLLIKTDENAQLLLEKELNLFNNVILAQSLSWPKKFLSDIRDITAFVTINHPYKKPKVTPQNYYADWAQRILEKIQFL